MTLRKEDKEYIDGRIREITRPQGWRKAFQWLREWGAVRIILAVPVAPRHMVERLRRLVDLDLSPQAPR